MKLAKIITGLTLMAKIDNIRINFSITINKYYYHLNNFPTK